MNALIIGSGLILIDLNEHKIDLMTIENRRFMYHPDGWLVLGAEDSCSNYKLVKSHAEEYYEVTVLSPQKLAPFDEFLRGWIGVDKPGKKYEYGIVHFAPNIPDGHVALFEKAFSFIEMALKNGFSEKTVLRGFPGKWEQTVGAMMGWDDRLDHQIQLAEKHKAADDVGKGKNIRVSDEPSL